MTEMVIVMKKCLENYSTICQKTCEDKPGV